MATVNGTANIGGVNYPLAVSYNAIPVAEYVFEVTALPSAVFSNGDTVSFTPFNVNNRSFNSSAVVMSVEHTIASVPLGNGPQSVYDPNTTVSFGSFAKLQNDEGPQTFTKVATGWERVSKEMGGDVYASTGTQGGTHTIIDAARVLHYIWEGDTAAINIVTAKPPSTQIFRLQQAVVASPNHASTTSGGVIRRDINQIWLLLDDPALAAGQSLNLKLVPGGTFLIVEQPAAFQGAIWM